MGGILARSLLALKRQRLEFISTDAVINNIFAFL
jgi:hypothetical protein